MAFSWPARVLVAQAEPSMCHRACRLPLRGETPRSAADCLDMVFAVATGQQCTGPSVPPPSSVRWLDLLDKSPALVALFA